MGIPIGFRSRKKNPPPWWGMGMGRFSANGGGSREALPIGIFPYVIMNHNMKKII
jgi:hypothetical protein